AMHRGNPNVAAAMAERALAEIAAIGGRLFEPLLVLALAYAQQGRTDEALVTLESVPAEGSDHPFTHAVSALIYTAVGQPEVAIGHADAVTLAPGATYLDQVFAYVAAAAAALQMAEAAQAELTAQAAVARALAVGDVVAIALSTEIFHAVTGTVHPAHDGRTQLGEGWTTLVQLLVGKGSASTPAPMAAAGE
ncbi:MAG: hypothetical protein LH616_14100, partial [Ilumatobacteraceae bacterium]|nr:hypothetical protein [Ilumatobacteraceae bacterium]